MHDFAWSFISSVAPLAPSLVSAERTEASVALIEWERLSLKDWRGNLTSYEIVYYEMLQEQCPLSSPIKNMSISIEERNHIYITENTTLSVVEGNIQVNITGLEAVVQYCVSVAARTSAGIGESSNYSLIPSIIIQNIISYTCFFITCDGFLI